MISTLQIFFCVFLVHPQGINPVGNGRKLFCEGTYTPQGGLVPYGYTEKSPACLGQEIINENN